VAAHDEKDCEWQLEQSIKAAMLAGVMKPQRLISAIVHTTVQPSAIADHTDSRLLSRAREQLVAPAQEAGIELRQRHARLAKTADAQG
jgi:IS5 family transposase